MRFLYARSGTPSVQTETPYVFKDFFMMLGLVCDSCDTISALTATLCSVCNSPLSLGGKVATGGPRLCPSCSSEVPKEHRFCGSCGSRVETGDLRTPWAGSGSARARLVLIRGEGQDGSVLAIPDGEHIAGRLEGGLMFPEDPLLSPRHATLFLRDSKLFIRDDNSKNGIFLRLRAPRIVPAGTILLIGEQLIRIDAPPTDDGPVPDAEGTYFYSSPHRASRLTLTQLLAGGEAGLVYRTRTELVTIGREGNDVNFPEDPYISGRHCQITALEDGRFQVTDLGSKNGTYEKIPMLAQLFSGDQLFLGQQLFRVELSA